MPITCECPQCGKRLKAPDSAAGKKAKCPDCGTAVPIPALKAKKKPADDDEFDLMKMNVDEGVEGPVDNDKIPCPMCGEMIKAAAVKCRYCGEELNKGPKKSKKKKRSSGSTDDEMQVSDYILCFICSGIACIASIIYMIQGKPKATKMFAISFGMVIFWNVVSFVLRTVLQK